MTKNEFVLQRASQQKKEEEKKKTLTVLMIFFIKMTYHIHPPENE